MFWVGLMDGNGNIQVNRYREKRLQYRFIIKLNNSELNYNMLIKIAKVIGGTVIIINNKKEVIWIMDKKEDIVNTREIFMKYPPLTSRLHCQLLFLVDCLDNDSVSRYLKEINSKYNLQPSIIQQLEKEYTLPFYYANWLSGFIEAKGNFLIKTKGNCFFSIEQRKDHYLLNGIKKLFNSSVKVETRHKDYFFIEIYKKENLNQIVNHCIHYPLLGEKSKSLYKIIKALYI